VQLRLGRTCDEAIKYLDGIPAGSLNNTRNTVPHKGATGFDALIRAAAAYYERWVDTTARELQEIFVSSNLESSIRSDRYWAIVTTDPSSPHLASMILAELNDLTNSFLNAANELRALKDRYKNADGRCLVLDTNDFLHYQRIDRLPWIRTYGKSARVVIPHVVLDEIDGKSYQLSSAVHDRARGIYRMLEALLDRIDSGGFVPLEDGTPCMFLLDEPGHRRANNNDEEIVSRAGYLQQYLSPGAVSVLTRDLGMRGRAQSWRLKAEKLPDNFLRSSSLSDVVTDQALSELD
jgi:hypothetical protein